MSARAALRFAQLSRAARPLRPPRLRGVAPAASTKASSPAAARHFAAVDALTTTTNDPAAVGMSAAAPWNSPRSVLDSAGWQAIGSSVPTLWPRGSGGARWWLPSAAGGGGHGDHDATDSRNAEASLSEEAITRLATSVSLSRPSVAQTARTSALFSPAAWRPDHGAPPRGARAFRVAVRPRITAGIAKHRTRRPLSAASSSSSSKSTPTPNSVKDKQHGAARSTATAVASAESTSKNGVVTTSRVQWRDAMRSPRKSAAFVAQSARDLLDWGRHMWAGMKLLAADVRVSWKVFSKVSQGKAITRRERNFMVQTGVDLARLVPFSLFLIVPLAEFALPFALRLFPNMLPSQFQSQMQKDENLRRQLKANIEIAKFLRDIVEEKAKSIKSSNKDTAIKKEAEELTDFLQAIRSGKPVDVSQVSRFARLFNDELTMDGAVRPQLVAMCKYMGISAHGTDQLLRFRLRSRLNAIKNDDMTITWEGGSNSLTDEEVVRACRDRGIRTVGVSKAEMRQQLSDWLDLSQDKAIPASLMIMSRAFLYTTGEEGLRETLSSLSDDVYDDVKMDIGGGDASNMDRLEEARRQSKLIEMESEREARKDKELAEKKKRMEEEMVAGVPLATSTASESISDAVAASKATEHEAKIIAEHFDAMPPSSAQSGRPPVESHESQTVSADQKAPPKEEIGEYRPPEGVPAAASVLLNHDESPEEEKSEEELAEERAAMSRVVDALSSMSSESAIERERRELQELKNELAVAESVLKSHGAGNEAELRRFRSTIRKLEAQVERIDAKLGGRMKLLDLDDDGVMSMAECVDAVKLLADDDPDFAAIAQEALRRLDADKDGNISRDDFDRVLKELQVESGGIRDEESTLHAPEGNGSARKGDTGVASKSG